MNFSMKTVLVLAACACALAISGTASASSSGNLTCSYALPYSASLGSVFTTYTHATICPSVLSNSHRVYGYTPGQAYCKWHDTKYGYDVTIKAVKAYTGQWLCNHFSHSGMYRVW